MRKPKGHVRVYKNKMRQAAARGRDQALPKFAAAVERSAKTSMKSGGGRAGIPSPPGTPPHVQTGALRASISFARDDVSYVVGPTERYGRKHEFGIPPYPQRAFMRPALQRVINERGAKDFKGTIE